MTYGWLEGQFFLLQHFDFEHAGHCVDGLEVIGHSSGFEEASSADLHSRIYDSAGNTSDHVYELEGDTLTIWGGHRGSEVYYRGIFSDDGQSCTGSWVFPGGGGHSTVMTRTTNPS